MTVGFIFYCIGLGSLLLTDMLVSASLTEMEIESWANFRSLTGIVSVLPVVGLDQVLFRNPESSAQLLRILLVQIPVVSLCVGIVIFWLGLVTDWWVGAALAVGSASCLVCFQYYRALNRKLLSQLAHQGWKFVVLVVIGSVVITQTQTDIMLIGVTILFVVGITMVVTIAHSPPSRYYSTATQTRVTEHYAIGIRFLITSLLLALSIYAEQLVVIRFATEFDAAKYFSSAVYFLFIPIFLNGYLAFLLGPWLRDRHDIFIRLLKRRIYFIIVGLAIYAVAMNLVGWALWQMISPSVGEVDFGLQVLFLLISYVRSLYLLPSGYIGLFGERRDHTRLILMQCVVIVPVICLYYFLTFLGMDIVYAVASASALNWTLRTFAGYFTIKLVAVQRSQKTI